MKINIKYEDFPNSKYISELFKELENDKDFERIIKDIRRILSIKPNLRGVMLRSQANKIPEEQIDRVIDKFPILQDFRKGIRGYIVSNTFVVSPYSYSIKLRVKNNKTPYQGLFTEAPNEEGVKIVLTSRFTPKELSDFIGDNIYTIAYHLRQLPTYSQKTRNKVNFERDRLVVYLHDTKKMSFDKIADYLNDNSNKNTLQKGYADFPYKMKP